MKPIEFEQANDTLGAPKSHEGAVVDLPIYRHPEKPWLIACFEMSEDEKAEIIKTGRVYVHIMGSTTYPIALDGLSPWRQETGDSDGTGEGSGS